MQNKQIPNHDRPVRVLDGFPLLIICFALALLFFAAGALRLLPYNAMRYLLRIFLYITLGEMWNLLSGFTGMTSLGQQAFIGIAGYTICVTSKYWGMPLGLGLLLAVIIGAIVALGLSFILFRMRGMYFAIATWVIAEALCVWFKSWSFVNMGGGMSVKASPYPRTPVIYLMSLILCAAALAVVYFLLRSKSGLGLTAMRDDLSAASSVGVNVFKSRLIVYIVAAVFCSLAGAIFFIYKGTIYPDSGFDIHWTVALVFIVIVGGVGTVSGPIVGAVIYVFLDEFLAHFPGWSNIILGAVAILVILFLPAGIMGTLQEKLGFEIFSQKRFSGPDMVRKIKNGPQ